MFQPETAPSVSAGQVPFGLRSRVGISRPQIGRKLAEAVASAEPRERLDRIDEAAHRWLVAHSMALLRMSLGAVFLGFGVLKLFPGVSPAQNLVEATTHILTFGLIPGSVALAGVAVLECSIGVCLLTGRAMRAAMNLLTVQMVGILSPVVLLAPRLFMGPHNAPTLEGQYVLKDIILAAAAMVIATTLRGGKLTSGSESGDPEQGLDVDQARLSHHA